MDNSSSSGSVSVDIDGCSPSDGQDYTVPTNFGPISVQIYGDQGKPALITYPDVGLNSTTCFQNFFSCPEASSLMLHNFCIFHINPPGHEQGACQIPDDQPVCCVDDLADQVVEVLDYFGLREVIGLGVTAGAYILTHLAMKYKTRVLGLILVSPICQAPSWSEWLYNKALVNLLYFWGMTNIVKEVLLQRYFGPAARLSDQMEVYRRVLDSMEPCNVMRFMQAIHQRKDLSPELSKLKCRTLIIAGEQSPFHSEAHHTSNAMDRRYNAVIEIKLIPFAIDFGPDRAFLEDSLLCRNGCVCESTGFRVEFTSSRIEVKVDTSIYFVYSDHDGDTCLWVSGHRGTTPLNVGAIGVLFDGLRIFQTCAFYTLNSNKPVESTLHFLRASIARKSGRKVETDQDSLSPS